MQIKTSMQDLRKTGLYKPKMDAEDSGGHAMCVVGYDQQKQLFKITNSWASAWGNDGFMFVSFEDCGAAIAYAHQIVMDRNWSWGLAVQSINEEILKMSKARILIGEFVFRKYDIDTNNFQIIKPV